jgi:hypothetical protein
VTKDPRYRDPFGVALAFTFLLFGGLTAIPATQVSGWFWILAVALLFFGCVGLGSEFGKPTK